MHGVIKHDSMSYDIFTEVCGENKTSERLHHILEREREREIHFMAKRVFFKNLTYNT